MTCDNSVKTDMRRFITFTLALAAVLVSQAHPIDETRARSIARSYLSFGQTPRLIRGMKRVAASPNADTPYLYIYSRGAGQGFVIVSGDDALPEVLAVVEEGDWDEATLPPHLLQWVERYEALVREARTGNAPSRVRRAPSGTRNIPVLCQTHWHQSSPYNDRCPYIKGTQNRALTGCVATAAAQVAYYWHKDLPSLSGYATPTYGYGDAPVTESVPKGTPLKWDLMRNSYNGSEPAEMRSAVADFVFITGASTWLTYGSSTSGQISNLVSTFNGQYQLSSECRYKSGTSQTTWEKLIIADLEAGRPIVYSGVHPDNGGHAVVLDGYRLSDNLFHFNFGWGGQGDGWYTVDDKTGMNGFNSEQGMTFKIQPKHLTLSGELLPLPENTLYQRVPNRIRARVTNLSTVPTSGISLYCLTSGKKPASGTPVSTDKTELPVGETVELEFSYKPPLSTSVYTLYLTDANKNILAQINDVHVTPTRGNLSLQGMDVNGATHVEEVPDGVKLVGHVANTTATVTATLTNKRGGTVCLPTFTCTLDTLTADGSYQKAASQIVNTVVMQENETADLQFHFKKLQPGCLYRASLSVNSVNDLTKEEAGADSVAFFSVSAGDLAIAEQTADEIHFTGTFNNDLLSELTSDGEATNLDLTAVEGRITACATSNRNALLYVADETWVDEDVTNVIRGGVCRYLVLRQGHNFIPRQPFHAQWAELVLEGTAGAWSTVVPPFETTVSIGMMARSVQALSSTRISKADSCALILHAGTPYLYRTCSDKPVTLVASDVQVDISAPNLGTDSLHAAWRNTTGTKGVLALNSEKGSFVDGEGLSIPALTAYAEYEHPFSATPTSYNLKDQASTRLIEAIQSADALLEDPYIGTDLRSQLEALRSEAVRVFTSQPERSVIRDAAQSLEEAVELLSKSIVRLTAEGWQDLTDRISNPSFESSLNATWEVTKPTGTAVSAQSTSSSLASYMAHADGAKVLYMTYKDGAACTRAVQTLSDLPRGYYRVSALMGGNYGTHHRLFANTHHQAYETIAEASAFGPMYLEEVSVDSVLVQDGELTLGVETVDGWLKADVFRLYFIAADPTPVRDLDADNAPAPMRKGVWTLSGMKVSDGTDVTRLPKGIYIVNGKKRICQ